MFTVMSELYRSKQRKSGLVDWEEAFGWFKNKINKYVGTEAFICVIQSVFKKKKRMTLSTEA